MGQRRASERQTTRRETDRQTEQTLGTVSRSQHKSNESFRARTNPHFSHHPIAKDLRLDPPLSLSLFTQLRTRGLGLLQEDSFLATT